MFGFIKKMFIGLLASIGNTSTHAKCISLNNQHCMTRRALINYILMNTIKDCATIHLWSI